jgi:hypothetical protein
MFSQKPYQGQDPEKARVVIVGIDANYHKDIEKCQEFFDTVKEYHQDGVAFWNKYGVHHPFLLGKHPFDGRTGGRRYHQAFAKMIADVDAVEKLRNYNLAGKYAEKISFVELLKIPTIGSTENTQFLKFFMEHPEHGSYLNSLIMGQRGTKKLILISEGAIRRMRLIER